MQLKKGHGFQEKHDFLDLRVKMKQGLARRAGLFLEDHHLEMLPEDPSHQGDQGLNDNSTRIQLEAVPLSNQFRSMENS